MQIYAYKQHKITGKHLHEHEIQTEEVVIILKWLKPPITALTVL